MEVKFNHDKLSGKIKEICKTQEKFGKLMGWSHTTCTLKIGGESAWKQDEIIKAANILSIGGDDLEEYFFTLKV